MSDKHALDAVSSEKKPLSEESKNVSEKTNTIDDRSGASMEKKEKPDPTRYGDWEKNGRCIDF